MPEPTSDREPESAATDEPSPQERQSHGSPLLMMSVKVREPATTPASKEKAADGVSAERSSAPCTTDEVELSMARGLCHSKGERGPDPQLSPGRAPVPEFNPRAYPQSIPGRAPVPELSTVRAPDPKSSPPSSPMVPASSAPPERPPEPAPPECTPVSAPVPLFSPGSPESHKCTPSHPLLPPPPLSSGSPSARPQPTIYAV